MLQEDVVSSRRRRPTSEWHHFIRRETTSLANGLPDKHKKTAEAARVTMNVFV